MLWFYDDVFEIVFYGMELLWLDIEVVVWWCDVMVCCCGSLVLCYVILMCCCGSLVLMLCYFDVLVLWCDLM